MKLLIITQKIDINDDLLGFMHGWIVEFAKHFEKVTVIALGVGLPCEISQGDNFSEKKIISQGDYHLPSNVKVLSLGKEENNASYACHSRPLRHSFSEASEGGNPVTGSRVAAPATPEQAHACDGGRESRMTNRAFKKLKYSFNFLKYIWLERKNYDGVFVHMNKEYMLLGGLFWRFWGKKTALWYNHGAGNILSVLAGHLAQKIFCTSPFSFFAKWLKTSLMPAGINTEVFRRNEKIQPIKNSILFLSRLSPIKGAHLLIEAANLLSREGVNFILNIVGEAGGKDKEYFEKLKNLAKSLEQEDKVKFWGKIPNYKTPEIYNQNEIVVNLTNSGSFDKIILEAMACEKPVLVCNKSFLEILPDNLSQVLFFEEENVVDLKNKLKNLLNEPQKTAAGEQLRAIVQKKHSLVFLSQKLLNFFRSD